MAVSRSRPRSGASPERVLQSLLAADPRDENVFPGRCAAVSDWPALADQAERHGVLGLLHRNLSASAYRLPDGFDDVLRRRAALQRLIQRDLGAVLNEVLAALAAASIETLALKGPVLGERLYGDPTLRVATDLDLMVARRDIPAASAVLEGLKFQTEPVTEGWGHHLKAVREGVPIVELHYRLTSNFGALVPSEDFLSRSSPYRTAAGAPCRVLSTEDELFYLTVHAAEHLFARLAWLLDVKALVAARPGLDWAAVAGRARDYGVNTAYRFAVDLIGRRTEIAIPPGATGSAFTRSRAAVAGALYSTAERSPDGIYGKILGHLFRAALTDHTSSGVRHLWRQFMRIKADPRGPVRERIGGKFRA